MLILVALRVMSITWMSVIAILVLAQKLLPAKACGVRKLDPRRSAGARTRRFPAETGVSAPQGPKYSPMNGGAHRILAPHRERQGLSPRSAPVEIRVARGRGGGGVCRPLRAGGYGVTLETKASVLPNCAGQAFSGAGFAVAGPLPSTPCWNASTAVQAAPVRLSV